MNYVSGAVMLLGLLLVVLAGLGLVRLRTTSARLHAAGKASPIAFLVTAVGAMLRTDGAGVGMLLVTVVVMALTLPVGLHLLFRATVRSHR